MLLFLSGLVTTIEFSVKIKVIPYFLYPVITKQNVKIIRCHFPLLILLYL